MIALATTNPGVVPSVVSETTRGWRRALGRRDLGALPRQLAAQPGVTASTEVALALP